MRILVLGGGGREHAIVTSLVTSPVVTAVMVAPGNGGTAAIAENVSLAIEDGEAVAAFARENAIDLVVIGPEAPLVAGVADSVRAAGIAAFGPGAEGARLEGSKEFAKELMRRHNIPTGESRAFTDLEPALAYLDEVGAPVVVKADGLAAGKGVTVAMDLSIARDAVRECFAGRFGEAGSTVLIEEYLVGPECSILAFTDGHTVLLMAPAQDHKRAYEDDQGPNTGGMGVYSPVPIVTPHEHAAMVAIMEHTVEALAEEDIDYRGVLYGGFILTDDGPKVLEFNARSGDPETQVVLPRLKSDLAGAMLATAEGRLADIDLEWSDEWAVSVVLASGGYPGDYDTDMPISGIDRAEQVPGVIVYHAGTRLAGDGHLLTAGGRVLNVTALGPDFASARERAYEGVAAISFDGMFYRSDIGARALRGRAAWMV
ncbi:MAG: phosphoribosylamine--glycine ligase [Anaerosomatales bacterium]|nr:phosphoribosylamine--glycine ligase [Anaerosomatales bacterium]MDT8434174.1 phosphoribosylamine--glycine ligase [Anaerosomatales bacterium]